MRRKKSIPRIIRGLLMPCIIVASLLGYFSAVDSLDSGKDAENLRQLENALRKGCAECYAVEGAYPPNLEYLEEHYGIQVDEIKYTVYYSMFAWNLMPDITVLENMP